MNTWQQNLYCEHCNRETRHWGIRAGLWEIYTCMICRERKKYKVG